MKKQIGPIRAAILEWMGVPHQITDLTSGQILNLMGGNSTSSGKHVTVDSALQLSTVWACTRLLSETISTLPIKVYQNNKDGSRTVAKTHPLHKLLSQKPNTEYTPSRFMLMIIASICLWGNAYVEKIYIGTRLVSLDILLPQTVRQKRLENGALEYKVVKNGKERVIPEDAMMHIRGFGIDGLAGLSPITQGRETVGSATAADQSAGKFFKKGMQPSGFLSTDVQLKNDQREQIRDNVTKYASSENAGRIMVLESGMKYQNITMNPEAAQLLETRSFNVEEICRLFRVPPFMIGHMDKQSSWASSVDGQWLQFLTNTLRPILVNIEQEIRRCLLGPLDADNITVEFSVEGLLRADSAGRSTYYNSALNNGWMSRNEVRRLENLPPIDGGDKYTVQSALIGIDQVGTNYGANNEPT
nr:phage portal protein [uncultured Psychrobacter sp.]